jgi:hypothetical protein
MNKRGIFMPVFVFFFIILLSYTLFTFVLGKGKTSVSIGEPQIELVKVYGDSEGDLLYLETCYKNAINNAVKNFLLAGGVADECDGEWKFGAGETCTPNFRETLADYSKKEAEKCTGGVVEKVEVSGKKIFLDLKPINYERKSRDVEIAHQTEPFLSFDSGLDIDELEKLKGKILECLSRKKFTDCADDFLTVDEKEVLHYEVLQREIVVYSEGVMKMEKPKLRFRINPEEQGAEIEV